MSIAGLSESVAGLSESVAGLSESVAGLSESVAGLSDLSLSAAGLSESVASLSERQKILQAWIIQCSRTNSHTVNWSSIIIQLIVLAFLLQASKQIMLSNEQICPRPSMIILNAHYS